MRRGVRVAGVLFVVVVAGCSGLPAVDTPRPVTVTPAAVPGDPAATETATPDLGAPGQRFSDPAAMAAAHRAVLRNTSYTVIATQTIRFPATGIAGEWRLTGRFSADGEVLVQTVRSGPVFGARSPIRADYWSDGRVIVERFSPNGSTSINVVDARRYPVPPPSVVPADPQLEGELTGVLAATAIRRLERVPAAARRFERVRIVATGPVAGDRAPVLDGAGLATDLRASLVVDERGLVHEYRLRYTGWFAGEPAVVTRSVRYAALGLTTVEPPPWAAAELNGTARSAEALATVSTGA